MIKFENIEVMGWEAAIRGMRNPMNSWEKGDSFCGDTPCHECPDNQKCEYYHHGMEYGKPYRNTRMNFHNYIGPNDLDLMRRLAAGGPVHAKYRRMITVYVDITAPLYWWKEFDTYKVGTVTNSCSTIHKIADKEFTLEDFSTEHLYSDELDFFKEIVDHLNGCRNLYLESKKGESARIQKNDWWQIIQLLPSSYNQKQTVMVDYEELAGFYSVTKNNDLDEWKEFGKWIEKCLPYSEFIIMKKFE